MNLNQEPTQEQLSDMLRACDDNAGHHIVWVDHQGEVHIMLLDTDIAPGAWAKENRQQIRLRYETYIQGNGYVGPDAAEDKKHVARLFHEITRDWTEGAQGYRGI